MGLDACGKGKVQALVADERGDDDAAWMEFARRIPASAGADAVELRGDRQISLPGNRRDSPHFLNPAPAAIL